MRWIDHRTVPASRFGPRNEGCPLQFWNSRVAELPGGTTMSKPALQELPLWTMASGMKERSILMPQPRVEGAKAGLYTSFDAFSLVCGVTAAQNGSLDGG